MSIFCENTNISWQLFIYIELSIRCSQLFYIMVAWAIHSFRRFACAIARNMSLARAMCSGRVPIAVYYTPAEVYGVAAGTPVALRAPSIPTASTHGDVSTLQIPSFCLENG